MGGLQGEGGEGKSAIRHSVLFLSGAGAVSTARKEKGITLVH